MGISVGFTKRFAASLLDGLVVFLPIALLSFLLFQEGPGDILTSLTQSLYMLILPVVWHGYVVGKKMMGIRIVKKDGSDVGIGAMLLRVFVAGLVYALTVGIGYIVSAFMVFIREDHRAIHDFIAGTYVTNAGPVQVIPLEEALD
ncbi:RDD family protein [Halobacillus sp. A1]|uniref:RDD family protein n=1 Tax=Halobacillus sp. A1 TaxID=2880262 RepID=UPI0020A6D227|nr:RDD family protein [Halobacillus sp. A1]MCP3032841.1 RDD family protein [Halobacillus sp. A1]